MLPASTPLNAGATATQAANGTTAAQPPVGDGVVVGVDAAVAVLEGEAEPVGVADTRDTEGVGDCVAGGLPEGDAPSESVAVPVFDGVPVLDGVVVLVGVSGAYTTVMTKAPVALTPAAPPPIMT